MKKAALQLFLLAIFLLPALAAPRAQPDEAWTYMPAGARPSYMGIHGGTMPVSLLVADDGGSLLTFVGLTGNDFLEALRKGRRHLPSFGNSTGFGLAGLSTRTSLFAGNATTSMPVFALSRDALEYLNSGHELEPFGLSDERISIEGQVTKPDSFPHSRSIRLFSLPDYFQPRRALPQGRE